MRDLKVDCWARTLEDDLQLHRVGGALTSIVLIVSPTNEACGPEPVLVRIYGPGTELSLNLEEEIRTFELAASAGLGPALLGLFANGRLEQVIDAQVLYSETIRKPLVAEQIAQHLAKFHIKMAEVGALDDSRGGVSSLVWPRTNKWQNEIHNTVESDTAHGQALRRFCAENHVSLACLAECAANLQSQVECTDLVLGHNDLQFGNIMVEERVDEQQHATATVHFIDLEYAGFVPRAFNIANHFAEYCYDYRAAHQSHIYHEAWFPSEQEQLSFISAYHGPGAGPSQLQNLREQTLEYLPHTHLTWSYWGLLSVAQCAGTVIDFDFGGYTLRRLAQLYNG
jgi:thiamine kinase-like enzyme